VTAKDYRTFQQGYDAAAAGVGLSDDPYGGKDGLTWRRGLLAGLDAGSKSASVGSCYQMTTHKVGK